MRIFGTQLRMWLDFLMVRQEDFAQQCDLNVSYIRNILLGAKPGGVRMPGRTNRDIILTTIARLWGQPVTIERFWEGPPAAASDASASRSPDLDDIIEGDDFIYKKRVLNAREREAVRKMVRFILDLTTSSRER